LTRKKKKQENETQQWEVQAYMPPNAHLVNKAKIMHMTPPPDPEKNKLKGRKIT